MRGRGRAALVAVLLLSAGGPAWALDYQFDGPIRKLGRGLANAGFGFWELPITVQETRRAEGTVVASTLGIVSGLLAGVQRTTIGFFEVLTFPFPQPNGTYQPLIQPEFLPFRK